MTRFWSNLLSSMPANERYSVSSYGDFLTTNKALLNAACDRQKIIPNYRALLFAMAMVETTTFSSANRDTSKDGSISSNVSLFNLNVDIVHTINPSIVPSTLNDPKYLDSAILIVIKAVEMWGVVRFLNFMRGGRTGFNDGVSFDCYGYRNTIATILRVLDAQPSLFNDSRRVNILLEYV